MIQFLPLRELENQVSDTRKDLAFVRQVASSTNSKVSALQNRTQYQATYIASETGKLRQDAGTKVSQYLLEQKTFARLALIGQQKEAWTLNAFLSRAMVVGDPQLEAYSDSANLVKLTKSLVSYMKVSTTLAASKTMDLPSLVALLDAALLAKDYVILSVAYNELSARATDEQEAEPSRQALYRARQEPIEEVSQAVALIDEASLLQEYLSYSMRSVSSGEEDIGLRMEGYIKNTEDREVARMHAQADMALVDQNSAMRVRTQAA